MASIACLASLTLPQIAQPPVTPSGRNLGLFRNGVNGSVVIKTKKAAAPSPGGQPASCQPPACLPLRRSRRQNLGRPFQSSVRARRGRTVCGSLAGAALPLQQGTSRLLSPHWKCPALLKDQPTPLHWLFSSLQCPQALTCVPHVHPGFRGKGLDLLVLQTEAC